VPWLRRVVVDATKTWIKEEMLWPQRMLIPAEKNVAKGEKPGFVLTETQLKKVLAEDPLLLAEQRLKVAAADRDWGDWTEARARRGPGVRRRGRPDGPGHRRGTHGPVQPTGRTAKADGSGAGLGVAQR
jgi:hypothetical protein